MNNLTNEETTQEEPMQESSQKPTSTSPNENSEEPQATTQQTTSLKSKRPYCRNANSKLEDYFIKEGVFDASSGEIPVFRSDAEIAELLHVNKWTVNAFRVKHNIPPHSVRTEIAMKSFASICHKMYLRNNEMTKALLSTDVPTIVAITVVITLAVAAVIHLLLS